MAFDVVNSVGELKYTLGFDKFGSFIKGEIGFIVIESRELED